MDAKKCSGLSDSSASASGKVYLIGDSVAAGASTTLNTSFKTKGFSDVFINAVPSRSLVNSSSNLNGLGVLASDKVSYSTASTVVVELGTNSNGLNAENIGKAIDTIKSANPGAKIFWVNVGADNSKRNGSPIDFVNLNKIIGNSAGLGYTVIDWSSQVKQHPEYIDSNPSSGLGVHLSSSGKPAYAEFIASYSAGAGGVPESSNCVCSGASFLTGGDNAEKIWNFLTGKGLTPVAAAGVMGNLQAESGFNPKRVQGTSTPQGDKDNMTIDGKTGYGIAQWTSVGRQRNLHAFAESRKTIDGDLSTQLDFLYQEAAGVWQKMNSFNNVLDATVYFHAEFERSADSRERVVNTRGGFAADILARLGNGGASGSSGSNDGCSTGGASASTLVKTAVELAWEDGSHGTTPKPSYVDAAAKVYPGASTLKLTNCSAYVAIVMRTSGIDPDYPTGCSRNQADYARAHPEKYDVADNITDINQLQAGDILVVGACGTSGHTFIFVGKQPKTEFNKADASEGSRMPNLGKISTLSDKRGSFTRIRIKG